MEGWTESTVVGRQSWAPGLMTLRLDLALPDFLPGQWTNLAIEADGERLRRAYSIASAPGAPLEVFVTRVDDGSLTPRLFDLDDGAKLQVDATPRGHFVLEELPPSPELWLVASGTGLGPFVSMLRHGGALARYERVVLVHGVRHPEQLAYRGELADLAVAHQNLRLVAAVSGSAHEGALHGRVTDALVDGRLEAAADTRLAAERSHVMLCGNPAMVRDMSDLLAQRGLEKHRRARPGHVTFEKYW